jgi:predicted nucleotidyltransferase
LEFVKNYVKTKKLDDIVNRIAVKFNPDKFILYGAYAAGNPNNDSDVDLLVIKDSGLLRQELRYSKIIDWFTCIGYSRER